MRILFCDDDPGILQLLSQYIEEFFTDLGGPQPETAAYTSGEVLLENEDKADIAFLDVEMPGINGIQIGAKLKEQNARIKIFIVTSFPDYLDEAMRFQVFRYLSKPIDKKRLFKNLNDALYQYHIESKTYAISTVSGVHVCPAEEILCVEGRRRNVILHTTGGDLVSTEPFVYWQNTLTLPCFYLTHRSFLVNMRYVALIEKDRVLLKQNQQEFTAYLTRRKYTDFKQNCLLYWESVT